MLTEKQLAALKVGANDGWMESQAALLRLKLIEPRFIYDELRQRNIAMGDCLLTGWGYRVARFYAPRVDRLPVGTLINHRIAWYKPGTVVLADDSNSICAVDPQKPLLAEPGGFLIPLEGGGITPGSETEGWYLRNYLGMKIKLARGVEPNDFR